MFCHATVTCGNAIYVAVAPDASSRSSPLGAHQCLSTILMVLQGACLPDYLKNSLPRTLMTYLHDISLMDMPEVLVAL